MDGEVCALVGEGEVRAVLGREEELQVLLQGGGWRPGQVCLHPQVSHGQKHLGGWEEVEELEGNEQGDKQEGE